MRLSESSYCGQISVAVALFGMLGPTLRSEREFAATADEHAVLVDDIGTYSRRISTNSPMAQKFFDQGLRLVYGYYFPEAIASFEEAQRYDPDHPMLDWGLALAMGPNPNSRKNSFPDDPHGDGKKAMANARAHLTRATPAERALIEVSPCATTLNNIRIAPFVTKSSLQPRNPYWIASQTTWKLSFSLPTQ